MKTTASGALSALLATIAVVVAATAAATPPLPPSPAITPGAGIVVADPAGTAGGTCTAGWLAHDREGSPVMLSAGHCDHGGPVSMKWATSGAYEHIGAFSKSVSGGFQGEASDFGVIRLDNSSIPADTRVLDRRPVAGVASSVQEGQMLCAYGNMTHRHCGHVTAVTPTKVVFDSSSEQGDSGGPVYAIRPDGDAVAVGIAIRETDSGQTVAELVQPWLDQLGLTLDATTAPSGAQRAGFGH